MYNYKTKQKGFMLIEAILATALVATSATVALKVDKRAHEIVRAKLTGKALADVQHAIDMRLLSDGYELSSGWALSSSATEDSIALLKQELIAADNPDCGGSGNWRPTSPNEQATALVSCNVLSELQRYKFRLDTERTARIGDDSDFKSWSLYLSQPNEKLFDEQFSLFTHIVNAAKLQNSTYLAATKRVNFVKLSDKSEITQSLCFLEKGNCALRFEVEANEIVDRQYLRTDGTSSMFNGITFKSEVDADRISCFDSDNKEISCGIDLKEYGTDDYGVEFNGQRVSASVLELRNNLGGTPVPVKCNRAGVETFCGFTVLSGGVAEAYVNAIYAEDFQAQSANVNGTLTANNIEVINTLTTKNAEITGAVTANSAKVSNLLTTRDAKVAGTITAHDAKVTNIFTARDAEISNLLTTKNAKVTEGLAASDASVSNLLTARNTNITSNLTARDANVINLFTTRNAKITNFLTAKNAKISETVTTKNAKVTETIAARDINVSEDLSVTQNASIDGGLEVAGKTNLKDLNTAMTTAIAVTSEKVRVRQHLSSDGTAHIAGRTSVGELKLLSQVREGVSCTAGVKGRMRISTDGENLLVCNSGGKGRLIWRRIAVL
ncbi:TPA: hypothetical protein ACF35N_004482 [Vibrio parahaemolyticus]